MPCGFASRAERIRLGKAKAPKRILASPVMVPRNYIPGVSSQFREEQHSPRQPASDEASVSRRGGDAVERQRRSTAQPSPQLRTCKSSGASRYYDTNLRLG